MRYTKRTAAVAAIVVFNSVLAGPLAAQVLITSPTYIAVPPPQQEIITPAPSSSVVWVPGSWDRTPDEWNWKPGEWVQPPFSNAYWVAGYWQHQGGQYQWEPAHWAAGEQGAVVANKVAMPQLFVEPQPAATVPNTVWTPGHWEWRGTWVWVPGVYVTSSQPQAKWVAGDWEAAADGTWRWNPAHWAMD